LKVPFTPDKRSWHPSVLPGQIVLVSTVDAAGRANVAPKSWISMVAAREPVLGFGCNVAHATYRNAKDTGSFVVNALPASEAERAWSLLDVHGAERLRASGLTLVPAQRVAAPLVAECRAHLECELDDVKYYDDEVFLFGRVVAASIDDECRAGEAAQQYERLRPVFFLEDGLYGELGPVRRIGDPSD
jgi:flavin reductase (DIM6/NTAB) family NADH-FMN oxidoreductase RutF